MAHTGRGEYGRTALLLASDAGPPSVIFAKVPPSFDVWMSHFDSISTVPPGFQATASTAEAIVAALEDPERRIYGVQFHPEVVHTHGGQDMLEAASSTTCAGAGRRGP